MGNLLHCLTREQDFEFKELGNSWSAAADNLLCAIQRHSRILPAVLAFGLSLSSAVLVYLETPAKSTTRLSPFAADNSQHSETFISNKERFERKTFRVGLRASSDAHKNVNIHTHEPADIPTHTTAASGMFSSTSIFAEIHILPTPVPKNSSTRQTYAKLASAYLAPFANRGKIKRVSFLNPTLTEYGICKGCFLVQVKNATIYVYDPHNVRSMTRYRQMRMRESLHFIKSAVARGVIDDTEVVVSVSDSVVTTSKSHSYAMPQPEAPRPLFASIRCNVSENIPFPMVLTDAMRRGIPRKFWRRHNNTIWEWDNAVMDLGKINGTAVAWDQKKSAAVFRGTIRRSTYLKKKILDLASCHYVGRTALWKRAREHEKRVRLLAEAKAQRKRIWPLPLSWRNLGHGSRQDANIDSVLDVQVEGSCGSQTYKTDRMSMDAQSTYKYIIHAEGNFFWADRLLLMMFGSNAIIKQATPCGMFFEPLLEPYKHFIPVDFYFQHLVRQTLWARENDKQVVSIVDNARTFAGQFLSHAAIQTYVDELLAQYSSLLEDRKFQVLHEAVQVYPAIE